MGWVMASVRHLRGHQFGNVVLNVSRSSSTISTTCPGRHASRAAASAWTSTIEDSTLHLFNVHLGTAFRERRDQAERLATIVHDRRIARAEDRARRFQRVERRHRHGGAEREAAGDRPELT